MISNAKRKIQTAVLGGFALILSISASVHTGSSKEEPQQAAANDSLTAGVASVFSTENTTPSYLTSGVAACLTDFDLAEELVAVIDADRELLANGQLAPEEITEDMDFFGYSNLAVANVEGSMLNVRKSPKGSVVGKMQRYAVCEVLGTEGDWTQITSGKVTGYVSTEYLLFGEEALAIAKEQIRNVAEVTANTLNVRKDPDTGASVLIKVSKGDDLPIVEVTGDWVKVEIDEMVGYVAKDYVDVTQKLPTALSMKELQFGLGVSETRVELVSEALKYVGNPYVWGGSSLTKGTDCSGFTMSIYAKYGIKLPHHSGSQPAYGKKIKSSEAKPGDLMFYGNGKKISHVGIYIGGGKIVHASSPRTGIIISNAYSRKLICTVSYLD